MSSNMMMSGIGLPQFISYSQQQLTPGNSMSFASPASGQIGDLLVEFNAAQAVVTWTSAGSTEVLDQGALPNMSVYYKSDSSGSDVINPVSSASTNETGTLMRWRSAQYDTIGAVATVTADGNIVIPGITSAGGVIICCMTTDLATGPPALTLPTGFTTIVNGRVVGGGQYAAIGYKAVIPGATGAQTGSATGITGGRTLGGVLIGLK